MLGLGQRGGRQAVRRLNKPGLDAVRAAAGAVAHQDLFAWDGCDAVSDIAYDLSETAFIFPITPSSPMGELMDGFNAAGRKNLINNTECEVKVMQSEGGAAGALHGAISAGSLCTTFTSSQGLLLMIPNLYEVAAELTPGVFHVAARAITKQALSIYGDHSDVMGIRQTGIPLLCSNTVQEAHDMALITHVATLKAKMPLVHFFDGQRTSAVIQKVARIPAEVRKSVFPWKAMQENLRNTSVNPARPYQQGSAQGPDIYFQSMMANKPAFDAVPGIVEETMNEVGAAIGRHYNLFDYFGDPEATRIAVCMGSGCETFEEAIKEMNSRGEKVGLVKVRLYRPWRSDKFMEVVPKTVQKVVVMDRTYEDGALANPLHLDVALAFSEAAQEQSFEKHPFIIGGTYGLSAKEFTPPMVRSCYANLDAGDKCKKRFTIGINDDVSHTSLLYGPEAGDHIASTVPKGTIQCQFWGLGGDGTVGANKEAIKTIADETDQFVQGHFAYTAHKSGGVTISHLRFGPERLQCEYEVQTADYVGVHHRGWLQKFPIVENLREGGVLVLNSPWTSLADIEANLPGNVLRKIVEKNIRFYNIDANAVAKAVGLGGRINNIMQSVFYKLSGVLEEEKALDLLRKSMHKMYGSKGEKVVQMNIDCIDKSQANLWHINPDIPGEWATASGTLGGLTFVEPPRDRPEFIDAVLNPMADMMGNDIPVSAMPQGGLTPMGTTEYERRGIAPAIPVWIPDKCTQCNYCALVCPHGVIRPFLLNKEEAKAAPPEFEMRKSKGGGDLAAYQYTIQVAPFDCTGCEVCTKCCPDDALYMAPFEETKDEALMTWEYARTIPDKDIEDKTSVKGSQFLTPGLEFSGACAGCGETPYVKLITQLFGETIVIANATGCSSIWGGSAPANPYKVPWANSLFEDNAEFGYGMAVGTEIRRKGVLTAVNTAMAGTDANDDVKAAMKKWTKQYNTQGSVKAGKDLTAALEAQGNLTHELQMILNEKDMFNKQSQWIVGGDGWAYDIGWGGLDHVIASGQNVNIMILDTEMYSNTGGQASKATPIGAAIKFTAGGNERGKKDLGQCAMSYGNVYVASIAMGADYNQTVKACREAEEFEGVSVIAAFSPCIDWGIQMANMMEVQADAVDSGYWPLYRYDPRRETAGQNPFQLDSKKLRKDLKEYLKTNNRYAKLLRSDPVTATDLQEKLKVMTEKDHARRVRQDLEDVDLLRYLKSKLGEDAGELSRTLILFGSETGCAQELAGTLAHELKRRDIETKVLACDDYDWDELANESNVIALIATCGQGELPPNCKEMWKWLNEDHPADLLAETKVSVFGLGDTHYVYFNEASKQFDQRFKALGAPEVIAMGNGDDQDEDKYETAFEEWFPGYCNLEQLKEPEKVLLPASYNIQQEGTKDESKHVTPFASKLTSMDVNRMLCKEGYDRDFRHYEFNIEGKGLDFDVGDTLGVYPRNAVSDVNDFLEFYGVSPSQLIKTENLDLDRKHPLPEEISAQELFEDVLDVFGKPKRRFYEMLSLVASDDGERTALEALLTEDGEAMRKEFADETVTYADVMRKFPSAKPGLEYLIDFVSPLKPRLYSIANSPRMFPGELHLFIVNDDWNTPSGRYRHGLTTQYLRDTAETQQIAGKINAAAVTMADDHTAPMICAGMGSGLAPLRAFIQDRVQAHREGEECGPVVLFFGSRNSKDEFFYESELKGYQEEIDLTIHYAFSRDQTEKVYVQTKMAEQSTELYRLIVEEGGYFYYCGAGGAAPDACRKAVREAIAEEEDISVEEAEQMICDMQIAGRYNVEAW